MHAEIAPGKSTDVGLYTFPGGGQSVCVFIKRTYDMLANQRMRRSTRGEIPLFPEPVEEDGEGRHPVPCLLHESDMAPRKPCTDVVIHGCARAPGAMPVTTMWTSVRVGALEKHVAVIGDRRVHWQPGARPSFGQPEPFAELPLTWRRAFGGIDGSLPRSEPSTLTELLRALTPEEHPGAYPRNPAGTGWVVNADERTLHGLALPNFEDPEHRLTPERIVHGARERWPSAPVPAGFGWVSQTWFPRSTFLGIGPDLPAQLRSGWLEEAPELREGPDPRFFSGASPGLRSAALRGDEPVELHGFHHEGVLLSALPDERPGAIIAFQRQPLETTLRLHTIELYADHHAASLLWVAEARPPRQLPLHLPFTEHDLDGYDLLEGVDVILDGLALPRA
jgi:hypothetical protein